LPRTRRRRRGRARPGLRAVEGAPATAERDGRVLWHRSPPHRADRVGVSAALPGHRLTASRIRPRCCAPRGVRVRQRPSSMPAARIQFPHHYRSLDPAIRRELVDHAAADGFPLSGRLYLPPRGEPDTVVVAMHPRVDFARHYLAPAVAAAGYAFFGPASRYLNNDADMLHERVLLDVAGTVGYLRERGFRTVVLLGNSGGGSLVAFYLQQSARA